MTEKLQVAYRSVEDLIPYARNARTHSDEQVARIASSIKEFGWTNPILVDGENGIIAGHGRLQAARKLKLEKVPVIELSGLTETQKRAYILADNKLALDAGWDVELLNVELEELKTENFDLDCIGFGVGEIEEILRAEGEEDDVEKPVDNEPYTAVADTVTYDPTGKICALSDCLDSSKAGQMIAEIEKSNLRDDEKDFLRAAAYRHLQFNYGKIADYYANSASPELQRLMEKSALVIVDLDSAIQNGYVKMSRRLQELLERTEKDETQ